MTSHLEHQKLRIVRHLFDSLHRSGVRYCHWKSNEHLGAAVAGKTDLDLLVERRARDVCKAIFLDLGFKRFVAPMWARYDGIEDHVGLDVPEGVLVHLHWHYELSVGRQGVKEYRLPWEELLLTTRRMDGRWGCYVSDPAVELLLLLVRAALKLKKGGGHALDIDMLREYHWLRARAPSGRVAEVALPLVGQRAARLAHSLVETAPTTHGLRQLLRVAEPPMSSYRRLTSVGAAANRAVRGCSRQVARFRERVLLSPVPRRRVSAQGGIVVAVIGPDGAGKSTIVQEVVKCLSWKLDVMPLYMGTAKPLTRVLRLLWPTRPPVAEHADDGSLRPRRPRPSGMTRAMGRMGWATAVALDKQLNLRRAAFARAQGLIVICDRYPQAQVMDFNDGPLLSRWRLQNSPAGRLARWEFSVYERAESAALDLVVRLNVSPEVAVARRPGEIDEEAIRRKVAAVAELQFPLCTPVVDVNADRPIAEVLVDVLAAIWAAVQ